MAGLHFNTPWKKSIFDEIGRRVQKSPFGAVYVGVRTVQRRDWVHAVAFKGSSIRCSTSSTTNSMAKFSMSVAQLSARFLFQVVFFPPVALKKMIRNMLAQNLKLIRQEGVGYESHSRMGRGMGESDPLPPEGSMREIVLTAGGYKSVGSLRATPRTPGV